jgi:hypothetical protein
MEVTVASMLLLIALAMAFSLLTTVSTSVARTDARGQTNDQVRQAVQEIDRQVRSGNVLYDPSTEVSDPTNFIAPGLSMRIYTQANGVQRCVQWRIKAGTLQMRSWSETWAVDGVVTSFGNVATNITNTASTPAFSLDPSPGFGGRLLKLDVLAQINSVQGAQVEIVDSVAGRNTTYGYPTSVCASIPPY